MTDPLFYVPLSDLEKGPASISKDKHYDVGFWIGTLSLGEKKVEIAGFDSGPLKGLVKIPVGGIGTHPPLPCTVFPDLSLTHTSDSWFAEDEKIVGPHPKDPYKRIECLPSSREIRIEVDGTVVARSTNNIFLHETSLRTRYYLSPTSVLDWSMLDPSDTSTFCPYKGQASYYHLRVGEREIKDAVWYYTYPTAESAQIQNRLCFYNEKVDVYVDGVKEE